MAEEKKKRLTEELVNEQIQKSIREFERIKRSYDNGFITENERRVMILNLFQKNFWLFLHDSGIRLKKDCDSYLQFVEDYRLYQKGEDLAESAHWLYSRFDQEHIATTEEKRLFFVLMDWFCLPPEVFEPLPEDIVKPERQYVHGYHSDTVYGIRFDCVDDGGLLEAECPVGNTFELTDVYGLKAVIKIVEDRRQTDRHGMDFDELIYETDQGIRVVRAEFLAEGCIEGYTVKERVGNIKILVRLCDNGKKVNWLAYYSSMDDDNEFYNYPLWQQYFESEHKQEADIQNRVISLYDKLMKDYHE